jgi:hypothetical protein
MYLLWCYSVTGFRRSSPSNDIAYNYVSAVAFSFFKSENLMLPSIWLMYDYHHSERTHQRLSAQHCLAEQARNRPDTRIRHHLLPEQVPQKEVARLDIELFHHLKSTPRISAFEWSIARSHWESRSLVRSSGQPDRPLSQTAHSCRCQCE